VEELGTEEDAPIMTDGYPMFEWGPGDTIIDEVDNIEENIVNEEIPVLEDNNVDIGAQIENDHNDEEIDEENTIMIEDVNPIQEDEYEEDDSEVIIVEEQDMHNANEEIEQVEAGYARVFFISVTINMTVTI
jgi:hypothetical protein